MTIILPFFAQFYASGAPATGLTVTVDIDGYAIADGTRTALVTAGSATECRNGLYRYWYTTADISTYSSFTVSFKTAGTADQTVVPSLQLDFAKFQAAAIAALITGVTVTTNSDKTGYTLTVTPPTAAQVRAEIDSNSTQLSTLVARNNPLDAAGIRTAIGLASANMDTQLSGLPLAVWNVLAATITVANSIGVFLKGLGVDTSGVTTLLSRVTGAVLLASGYTAPPTVGQIDTQLSGTHGAGVWASAGSGSIQWSPTQTTNTVTHQPIAQVAIWVTTDSAGANTVAAGSTDDFGNVKFQLNAGTYYIWKMKAGYTFNNPETGVVT